MIIVNLIGGLGNQMFQYSAARSLAIHKEKHLLLDAGDFSDYRLHRFELTRIFSCISDLPSPLDFKKVLCLYSNKKVRGFLKNPKLKIFRPNSYVLEPHFHYWKEFMGVPNDCYLVGYWQSEKYFKQIESTIREDFVFKIPMDEKNLEISRNIKNCESVSLHIRRGDYIADGTTNQVHGTCSLDYYERATEFIAERIKRPSFFVFSDDIAWAKTHLKLNYPCAFIGHNQDKNNYLDMQLMSLCKHNIIANSSFSWWGAWLNTYEDKIVIAPKQWFATERRTDDLIPDNWLRL